MGQQMHSFYTFIKRGLKEKSTYIGAAAIILSILFSKQLYTLVNNILASRELENLIITKIPIIIGGILIWYKEK
jgi:hypothetical protein